MVPKRINDVLLGIMSLYFSQKGTILFEGGAINGYTNGKRINLKRSILQGSIRVMYSQVNKPVGRRSYKVDILQWWTFSLCDFYCCSFFYISKLLGLFTQITDFTQRIDWYATSCIQEYYKFNKLHFWQKLREYIFPFLCFFASSMLFFLFWLYSKLMYWYVPSYKIT